MPGWRRIGCGRGGVLVGRVEGVHAVGGVDHDLVGADGADEVGADPFALTDRDGRAPGPLVNRARRVNGVTMTPVSRGAGAGAAALSAAMAGAGAGARRPG